MYQAFASYIWYCLSRDICLLLQSKAFVWWNNICLLGHSVNLSSVVICFSRQCDNCDRLVYDIFTSKHELQDI